MANTNETYAARIQRKLMKKQYLVEVATGRRKADLVLKNASYVNVFSNELCHGDIAVAKGQIVGMGDYAGEVEYDVSGKIVCPGFIDAHTHFDLDVCNTTTADNFTTGSRAALRGGTTTVVDFACPNKGETLAHGLQLWHEKADGRTWCDYSFICCHETGVHERALEAPAKPFEPEEEPEEEEEQP